MRRKQGLAGLAILALAVTAIVGGNASADPVAHSAGLKKCLKKAKQIQDPVKRKKAKRRCRKKFGGSTIPTTPLSLVRASVTATQVDTSNFDIDLFVFDASGNRAGNGADAIPQSSLSPDIVGAGTETFTDLNAGQHRAFSFGVCYAVGGSQHTTFTITFVTSDGASHTETRDAGNSGHFDYPANGVAIPSGYCPPNPF